MVELNHALYHDLIAGGFSGVWGDITSEEILHAAGVGRARILLMTVPDKSSVRLSVERARRLNPKMTVIARAARAHHVAELHKLGVEAVVQPEFEGGVEMVRQALVQYHGDDAANARLLSAVRREFYGGAVYPAHVTVPGQHRAWRLGPKGELRMSPAFALMTVPGQSFS